MRIGRGVAAVAALSALLASAGCGDAVLKGRGSSYLIVTSISGASGAEEGKFFSELDSDVLTLVKKEVDGQTVYMPTVFQDPGQVSLRIAMKDPTGVGPSDTNVITIDRYRVEYVRSDGRNTQGVDVPYAFDGAATGTIGSQSSTVGFVLVRAQAKLEAPLMAMRGSGGAVMISTIAKVTFYGRDQAGSEVSVSANISVNFADWGDPD